MIRMTASSQRARILRDLRKGRTITPLQALRRYGCFRLGARIYDLKRDGHRIETLWEENGKARYARYRLLRRAA